MKPELIKKFRENFVDIPEPKDGSPIEDSNPQQDCPLEPIRFNSKDTLKFTVDMSKSKWLESYKI